MTKAEIGKAWRALNKEKIAAHKAARHAANPEPARQRALAWQREHSARVNEKTRKWNKANKHKRAAMAGARRARQLRATPKWANAAAIDAMYLLAKTRSETTADAWVVDHIYPLNSKVVCGLHVEHNLRVITRKENATKSNRVYQMILTEWRHPYPFIYGGFGAWSEHGREIANAGNIARQWADEIEGLT